MKNYSKILANSIAIYRKKMELTQEALAEKLGISFQAVSKWENEQSHPDITFLPELSEIFGITIDELFGKETVNDSNNNLAQNFTWDDDEVIRGVVFRGHKIVSTYDDMQQFTFKIEGQVLDVISQCNIECGEIKGNAAAGCDINCKSIYGNVAAGCDINCGGMIAGVANAGCDINYQ